LLAADGRPPAAHSPLSRVVSVTVIVRLEQVLTNLLDDAAKYTGRGGRTGLTVVLEVDDVVISVRDDGIGIAKEALPSFSACSGSRSRGGLGVELALVRQSVNVHGGSVNAASAGPGRGSEFI
jgi:signal transduction histidine kinase